jgi:hypothetical protein
MPPSESSSRYRVSGRCPARSSPVRNPSDCSCHPSKPGIRGRSRKHRRCTRPVDNARRPPPRPIHEPRWRPDDAPPPGANGRWIRTSASRRRAAGGRPWSGGRPPDQVGNGRGYTRGARLGRERLDRVDELGADAQLALQQDFLPGADRPVPRVRRGVPAEAQAAELVADLVGPCHPGDAGVAAGGELSVGGLRGASRAHGGHRCGTSAQAPEGRCEP